MKKILVICYSQSGQLSEVVKNFTLPLQNEEQVQLVIEQIEPVKPYPFPWPFLEFIDIFPEAVYLDPPPIQPTNLNGDEDFDLIILAYQVWFLSPSLPVTAFLQSDIAARLFKDKPVVTLIACRNMWLMAQEQMKQLLTSLGARLVGNVALVDEAGSIGSFLATPVWVLSGEKGPHWGGLIPRAGVSETEIFACQRFGDRILEYFHQDKPLDKHLFDGLNPVYVDETLIASEKIGRRSFRLWGKLFRAIGKQGTPQRRVLAVFYVLFLITLIVTVVPLVMLIKKLITPLTRERIARQKAYYGNP